jgi:hypothetical protein
MTDSLLEILDTDFNEEDEGAPTLFELSPYYEFESAAQLLKTKSNMLTLLSLNCQSLNSKFAQLQGYINDFENSNFKFSIICLQETWLSENHDTSLLQLEGYKFIHQPRGCSIHGGVAIYLRDCFEYKILPYHGNLDIWDGIFIEIVLSSGNLPDHKRVIIGNIYRPPRENVENYLNFYENIQQIISNYSHSNVEIIITGDFNIDLLKIREKTHINDFLEILLNNGLIPKITLPTRLTDHSKTLIDNCFVKLSVNFSKTTAGILLSNISDHQPYFVAFDYLKLMKHKIKFVKSFTNSKQAKLKFKNELQNTLTMALFKDGPLDDPNDNYSILDKVLQSALNKHMPIKYTKYKKHKHKKSAWITHGIINSIRFRDRLYQRLRNTPTSDAIYNTLKINLQTYNRILKQNIRKAKADYYKSCFLKYRDDMKNTWATIKEIMNKTTDNSNYPKTFIIDNSEVNDPKIIADIFNKYFVQIGPKLASNIHTSVDYKSYLQRTVTTSFKFSTVHETQVSTIIDRLKPKTSCGKDRLSNKLLKFIKLEVLPFITMIINQSINTGLFPDILKIAKVLPIYKKDDHSKINNYRPISMLPSISKVFERVIHNQLYDYFDCNSLFYQGQYGFRCKHSTELAALETLDRIVNVMDKNGIPMNIYLDLSKAFDTLDHEILIQKLSHYGIQDSSLRLLNNYLTNRKQYVQFNDVNSDLLTIETGVPQGSILGPLLFIVYLNDLAEACKIFIPVIYADDTTLGASLETFGLSKQVKIDSINTEHNAINLWFKANKLSINESKTKAMLFHTVQRDVENFQINLNGTDIEFVTEFNYLGINFDSNINWKSHIQKICNKISRTSGVMTKLKHYLPTEVLKMLYNSLIFPYLNYGILVWGVSANKLLNLQKKIIRTVACPKYNAHTFRTPV